MSNPDTTTVPYDYCPVCAVSNGWHDSQCVVGKSNSQTTEVRHILTPIPGPNGRGTLCGAPDELSGAYGGLDEAYRAHVEGWAHDHQTCRDCLKVALTGMEFPV